MTDQGIAALVFESVDDAFDLRDELNARLTKIAQGEESPPFAFVVTEGEPTDAQRAAFMDVLSRATGGASQP